MLIVPFRTLFALKTLWKQACKIAFCLKTKQFGPHPKIKFFPVLLGGGVASSPTAFGPNLRGEKQGEFILEEGRNSKYARRSHNLISPWETEQKKERKKGGETFFCASDISPWDSTCHIPSQQSLPPPPLPFPFISFSDPLFPPFFYSSVWWRG